MYLVRDVFKAKAGKSKELLAKLKAATPLFQTEGVKGIRLMSDTSTSFWTIVWEFEVEKIEDYFKMSSQIDTDSKIYSKMEGYQEHVLEGHREIFKIEN